MADIQVRKEITLISPSNKTFNCQWAGGTRQVKKRLAMYGYAGINGQVVDDYGCDSITYPIQLLFTGEDHKRRAKEFFIAFREVGKWEVYHPTEGFLPLQGVEATENDQPVKEALVTRIDTQWVEYIDPLTLKSLRNMSIELGLLTIRLEDETEAAARQALDDSPAGIQEANRAARSIVTRVIQNYNKGQYYAQEAADAQEQMRDDIAMGFVMAAGFVSSTQNIIKAPARGISDLKARVRTLKNIISDLFAEENDPIEPSYNDAIIKEVAGTSALSAMAEGFVVSAEGEESGIETRSELQYTIDAFNDIVDTVVAGTDRLARKSSDAGTRIENAYIPFEQTNTLVKTVVANSNRVALDQYFRLPTETRHITKKNMTIYEVADEYYGGVGDNDEILDKIERSNKFTDGKVLLLPRGTLVRIYE